MSPEAVLRRMTTIAATAGALTLTLALSACGARTETDTSAGDAATTESAGSTCAEPNGQQIGLAFDVGGRGDQSFNDSAARGADQAACEFGYEVVDAEAQDGEPESAREERLRQFADAGVDPIIAVGFAYAPAVDKVAKEYPDSHFALIDSTDAQADNISNLVFAEEQGSFLVGAAAALKSETNEVGFIGGVDTPLIKKFEAGYTAGVKAVDPETKVDVTYLSQPPDFSGFGDPAKGKTAAAGMYDSGADIIFHAAGGSGGGVFEAAQASNNLAIGVDSDQYKTADPSVRDVILTSMLKNVDVAVSDYLTEVDSGTYPSGTVSYDLEADGVGYATSGGKIDDITDQLDQYKQKIIDGQIKVPLTP